MLRAEVESRFLKTFDSLYPQFAFRGMRRFPDRARSLYGFALRLAFGKAEIELDILCATLIEGDLREVRGYIRRIGEMQATPPHVEAIPVLIAPYLSEKARALCRQAEIGYFDLAGNAGLDTPRVFLHVAGRTDESAHKRRIRNPFAGKAERVVRRLLLGAETHWSMRELAKSSSVSLGLASMVTSSLAETGLVAKDRSGLSVYDPAGLLDAWAERYSLRRSAYRIYHSDATVADLHAQVADFEDVGEKRYALTLWSGAHFLLEETDLPPHLALYWMGHPVDLALDLSLQEDLTGKTGVFVFQPYDQGVLWERRRTEGNLWIVNPLQLYLDLSSGDAGERHLAQRVRERLLSW